jgi:ribosomal protein S18 acetylase RimI-like enzyme
MPKDDDEEAPSPAIEIFSLIKSSKQATKNALLLQSLQSLERHTFPSSESLSIAAETSKRNTHLLYAQTPSRPIAYLIYIHSPSGMRIHKVCVAEEYRRRGVATKLITRVCEVARHAGKEVDLWVDEDRRAARECYFRCGFVTRGEMVRDYYGPGRNALRMVWKTAG